MAADSKKPLAEQRGYTSVPNAIKRIAAEEGVAALYAGAGATVARAMLLNAGQLAVYSQAKETLAEKSAGKLSGIPLMLTASLFSAFAAVGMSSPADVIKSRMQNMKPGEYTSMADCFKKTVAGEGPSALYKGFGPSMIKLAPHTVISFLILDNLTKLYTGKEAM
jgi:solute carrier family 25 oxoglutarate transporter 11